MSNKADGRHAKGKLSRALADHPVVILTSLFLAGLAAAVTILVPLFPENEASSPAELSVDFGAYKSEVTSFVVPVSAPFENFPFASSPGFTQEQYAWLSQHGQERRQNWSVEFRSTTAGVANMLALENLRLRGTVTPAAPPGSVFVDCPDAGVPDMVQVVAPIGQNVQGTMTTLEDQTRRPFMFNLEPGEAGLALVHLSGSAGFEGDVTFDVASADSKETTVLNDTPILLPPLGGILLDVSVSGGTEGIFQCRDLGDQEQDWWACSPEQIRTHIADECTASRLRSATTEAGKPLSDTEDIDAVNFVYDTFVVHGCEDGYALVEASISSSSSFDFWAMKESSEGWYIALVASTGIDTPRSQALFSREALDQALDGELIKFEAAIGTTTKPGRSIVG